MVGGKCSGSFQVSKKVGAALGILGPRNQSRNQVRPALLFQHYGFAISHFSVVNLVLFGGVGVGVERENGSQLGIPRERRRNKLGNNLRLPFPACRESVGTGEGGRGCSKMRERMRTWGTSD